MDLKEYGRQVGYEVLDERVVRGSSGIMLLLGTIASINGFILKQYEVIPYISGFLVLNFFIGVFFNPNYSPTMLLAKLIVRKQTPLPIGAVQKRFAWTLGLLLSLAIFAQSFMLLGDSSWFDSVCLLCMICILFLYLESVFGICVGCKLYYAAVRMKLIRKPDVNPNCMGDSCDIP